MPNITFQPANKTIDVPPGTGLLEAARQAGVTFESPCGGKGTCGKCLVQIIEGKVDSDSLGLLSKTAIAQGYVLACKTTLQDTPVTVHIPEQHDITNDTFISDDDSVFQKKADLFPVDFQFHSLTQKHALNIPPPQLEDGLSDLDRITRELQKIYESKIVTSPLSVIQTIADTLRRDDGNITVTVIKSADQLRIVDIEAEDTTKQHYGVAIDAGTTTIAVQLVSLPDATVIATRTGYNEQIACGLDVISRINYARQPERLQELRTRVLDSVNRLIRQLCQNYNVPPRSICESVIAGNTTMIHLLLGLKPEYIRLEPYTPTIHEAPYLTANEVGIEINPQSRIYFSPHVGSYVGGDITSGILCTDLAKDKEEVNIFIDIGTNGEIVIGNTDFLMTCACSAGPAFEGGGIDHGMRASPGAIDNVAIDEVTGQATWRTIGGMAPKGICGSGMISLLANLFLSGWLDAAGKLNREKSSPAIRVNGRRAEYIIVPENESSNGKAIIISETDIENIIRAKAAIYSACALLLDQVGLTFQDISKIYIAGGFGRHLNIDHAITIGLIPDLARNIFQYIGNSSLMGAYMTLVSEEYRDRQMELAHKMTYIELNTDPGYMDQYTGAMFLPHTNEKLFPSIKNLTNSGKNGIL